MPSCRANPLNPTRIVITAGLTMHHCKPVVQIAIVLHVVFVITRTNTTRGGVYIIFTLRYHRSISVAGGFEVFSHPYLTSDAHSVVLIAINVFYSVADHICRGRILLLVTVSTTATAIVIPSAFVLTIASCHAKCSNKHRRHHQFHHFFHHIIAALYPIRLRRVLFEKRLQNYKNTDISMGKNHFCRDVARNVSTLNVSAPQRLKLPHH